MLHILLQYYDRFVMKYQWIDEQYVPLVFTVFTMRLPDEIPHSSKSSSVLRWLSQGQLVPSCCTA